MKKKGKDSENYTEFDLGEKVNEAMNGLGAKHKPGHTAMGKWWLGAKLNFPTKLEPGGLMGGGLIGVAGQRVLERVTPMVTKSDSKLLTDGINAVLGVIPYAVKQHSITVGIALPGLFELGGSLADYVLDYTGLNRPQLAAPKKQKKVADGGGAEKANKTAENLRAMAGDARAQGTDLRGPKFTGNINERKVA